MLSESLSSESMLSGRVPVWVSPTFGIPVFGIPDFGIPDFGIPVGIPGFGIPTFGISVEFRHPLIKHPLDSPQEEKRTKDQRRIILHVRCCMFLVTRIAATSNRKSLATAIATQRNHCDSENTSNTALTLRFLAGEACDFEIVIANR